MARKTTRGGRYAGDESDLRAAIGRNMRALREARRLTLGDLERATGATEDALIRVERYGAGTSLSLYLRICAALGCWPGDLLPEDWREMIATAVAAPQREVRGARRKLTDRERAAIVRARGKKTAVELAAQYRVSTPLIYQIWRKG